MVSSVSAGFTMVMFPVSGSISNRPPFPKTQTNWAAANNQRLLSVDMEAGPLLTAQERVRYLIVYPRVSVDGVKRSWFQLQHSGLQRRKHSHHHLHHVSNAEETIILLHEHSGEQTEPELFRLSNSGWNLLSDRKGDCSCIQHFLKLTIQQLRSYFWFFLHLQPNVTPSMSSRRDCLNRVCWYEWFVVLSLRRHKRVVGKRSGGRWDALWLYMSNYQAYLDLQWESSLIGRSSTSRCWSSPHSVYVCDLAAQFQHWTPGEVLPQPTGPTSRSFNVTVPV